MCSTRTSPTPTRKSAWPRGISTYSFMNSNLVWDRGAIALLPGAAGLNCNQQFLNVDFVFGLMPLNNCECLAPKGLGNVA